jgi:RNA polymerase subunit RPABC4/transcription elongation factor Spt4
MGVTLATVTFKRHCPSCSSRDTVEETNRLRCNTCGFVLPDGQVVWCPICFDADTKAAAHRKIVNAMAKAQHLSPDEVAEEILATMLRRFRTDVVTD